MKLSTMIVIAVTTMGMACSQIPSHEGVPMNDVEVIKSEYYSNYPEGGEVTKKITSHPIFDVEWEKVHAGMDPVPELPPINFDERDVILLMLETKPTGGYGIDHYEVLTNPDQLIVRFAESHPGDQCGTIQALTRPFMFISIPKSDKEVTFLKEETVVKDCNE